MSGIDAKALAEQKLVDPAAIERELASLWQNAGADQGQGVVTRACAWNVVVHVERRPRAEGAKDADRLVGAMKELPRYIASRTIFLETLPPEDGQPPLESWISANCLLADQGGKYVCSEEITILSRGAGEAHLPGLVRALAVPDVPTAVLFASLPPKHDPAIAELIEIADRLLVDATSSAQDGPLGTLLSLFPRCPLGVADLGWRATAPLRNAISDLFEGPQGLVLGDVDRVRVVAPPARHTAARLLLQWVASCMGAERVEWTTKDDGRVVGPKPLHLEIRDGEELSEIAFLGSKEPLLARPSLAPPPSEVSLIAEALGHRREDPALKKSLMMGG
ncbi:MAG: glucose-6-phosphate dehydrogenase assembly protein OpcA [Myxococcota bacterium]